MASQNGLNCTVMELKLENKQLKRIGFGVLIVPLWN